MSRIPLDPEIERYIDSSLKYYPGNADNLTIEEERHCYLSLCRAFQADIPEGIDFSDDQLKFASGRINIRIYEKHGSNLDTLILYFHGGGFILGDLESHHSICAEMCARTGYKLISVDYSLAPEVTYPAQIIEAVEAFRQLDRGGTIIAGDSAGGLLAAAVCISLCEDTQKPIGQLLIYPTLGGRQFNYPSYSDFAHAPGLSSDDNQRCLRLWSNDELPWSDPLFAPLVFDRFQKLPPCIAAAAEFDPLKDDAGNYVEKLLNAGVDAEYIEGEGLIHGHLRIRHHEQTGFKSLVASSIGPYGAYLANGAEYTGDYNIDEDGLVKFHRNHIAWADNSDSDVIACETIPNLMEAKALNRILYKTKKPGWVSFSCRDGDSISDGTSIVEAAGVFNPNPNVLCVGINCTSPQYIDSLVTGIRKSCPDKHIIVYPSSGARYDAAAGSWSGSPGQFDFIRACERWVRLGVKIIGGCCGIGPGEIAQWRKPMDSHFTGSLKTA